MSEPAAVYEIRTDDKVRVRRHPEWGTGEVLRVSQTLGVYQAKVLFKAPEGERVENLPIEWLEKAADLWERLAADDFDDSEDYRIRQMALDLAHANTGGELTASRVDLLPHQILLVHDLLDRTPRRLLVADEVGLGKTIETGMLIRELIARGEAARILIVAPAGLIENWRSELAECFRLTFDVLGRDFRDHGAATWERYPRVICSIDTLKQRRRVQRLLAAPPWDLVIFDEAHHLSRTRSGKKTTTTQNYRLAEALRNHSRDMLFLSATPHQGNAFQFWSLIQLLDDQLFAGPEAIADHRGLLNHVMIRRTKREVTDSRGGPIFRRRQVHTERFSLGPRERMFYERISDYLREGYDAAGAGDTRTTRRQRAIGFVMTTFQKIMSSSPRAIRQALRRRLLVLLARRQLDLEARRTRARPAGGGELAEEILRIQDEMLKVARAILGEDASATSDAEAYVARVRRRLQRREEEAETTSWTLDGDEEAGEGLYAETGIPEEIPTVRQLIKLVPQGPDRRFETLVRAISDLSRENPDERFVIFTQYRDTLAFLAEELGRIFGAQRIATLKGGPIEDKIAAMEDFWREDGARFLLSTSAGGEGINLQIGRILFNYDLPWNPMAVEQRIGRIHRYGQQETVQVYNLFAEDTVEERIYGLLDAKLREIALSIGKSDDRGQPAEDFRSDILGLLGARPDYQNLFKRALVDRDYRHTEAEIARMLAEANRAAKPWRPDPGPHQLQPGELPPYRGSPHPCRAWPLGAVGGAAPGGSRRSRRRILDLSHPGSLATPVPSGASLRAHLLRPGAGHALAEQRAWRCRASARRCPACGDPRAGLHGRDRQTGQRDDRRPLPRPIRERRQSADHPGHHPAGRPGRSCRARRADRVARQRRWTKRTAAIGRTAGCGHARQSFRGGEEQHDPRLDTGSAPQGAGDEPARRVAPSSRNDG